MDQEQWYYLSEKNEVEGPVSAAELKSLKSNLQITGETQICKGGEDKWVPYGKALLIDGTPTPTQNISNVATPPPIPQEQRSWFYAESGNQFGPLEESQIAGLIHAKKISRDTIVWRNGMSEWTQANKTKLNYLFRSEDAPALQGKKGMSLGAWIVLFISFVFCVPIVLSLILPWLSGATEKGKLNQQLSNGRQVYNLLQSASLDASSDESHNKGFPADIKAKSAQQVFDSLVSKGYVKEDSLKPLLDGFEIGNVSSEDPGNTILLRSQPKRPGGPVCVILSDGEGFIIPTPDLSGKDVALPPREPQFLPISKTTTNQSLAPAPPAQSPSDDFSSLTQKALQGDAKDQCNLGVCYQKGEGVPKDMMQALSWYRKAADQGSVNAQHNLGTCYLFGYGVPKDIQQAIVWYHKAADQGDADSQHNLGSFYSQGNGVPIDLKESATWYRKAADQGIAQDQCNIGVFYENGEGVPKDMVQALAWYHKAADQGDMTAQYHLGLCYSKGNGVPKDIQKAIAWYHKAADQGDADSQHNLGSFYSQGNGVPIDLKESATWYRKAADQGIAQDQCVLGLLYYQGNGVPKDLLSSVYWLTKAADQGFAQAQQALGLFYENGVGVPKDFDRAIDLYRKAANQGDATAQQRLRDLEAR